MQSHDGVLRLLPALPSALRTGRCRGLVARPGVRVDLDWLHGRLDRAVLTARRRLRVRVALGQQEPEREVDLPAGVPYLLEPDG